MSGMRVKPVQLSPTRTAVEAGDGFRGRPLADGVGAFFSGGLDSFYTVLTRREKIRIGLGRSTPR